MKTTCQSIVGQAHAKIYQVECRLPSALRLVALLLSQEQRLLLHSLYLFLSWFKSPPRLLEEVAIPC